MKIRALSAIISVGCVLLMFGMTFQPAAACNGPDETIMQQDIFIDENGNTHMVYSQLVKYYEEQGNHRVPRWQSEVFYKNNVDVEERGHGHGNRWNTPIQISISIADSQCPQVTIDDATGIIYVVCR
jgi:hypothetical protein